MEKEGKNEIKMTVVVCIGRKERKRMGVMIIVVWIRKKKGKEWDFDDNSNLYRKKKGWNEIPILIVVSRKLI